MKNKEIVMYDDKIKAKQPKSYTLSGFGILLIIFGLISFGYKNGRHGISDTFTYSFLIIGFILIILDLINKK